MIECPSCGRRQAPSLICAECGAPLAAPLDCFAALELPRDLTIDLDALERRYHELSRMIHPDRFASKGPKVRDASLRATATLTRSYRTLRDPVARGLYWLELNGEKLAENNQR
ncbi:MAG: Fe-S protein assembly co-chaperone HscB, partial [Candidatus Binatus sp.]